MDEPYPSNYQKWRTWEDKPVLSIEGIETIQVNQWPIINAAKVKTSKMQMTLRWEIELSKCAICVFPSVLKSIIKK